MIFYLFIVYNFSAGDKEKEIFVNIFWTEKKKSEY